MSKEQEYNIDEFINPCLACDGFDCGIGHDLQVLSDISYELGENAKSIEVLEKNREILEHSLDEIKKNIISNMGYMVGDEEEFDDLDILSDSELNKEYDSLMEEEVDELVELEKELDSLELNTRDEGPSVLDYDLSEGLNITRSKSNTTLE